MGITSRILDTVGLSYTTGLKSLVNSEKPPQRLREFCQYLRALLDVRAGFQPCLMIDDSITDYGRARLVGDIIK